MITRAALCLAGLALIAACGGDGKDARAALRTVVEKTEAADSYRQIIAARSDIGEPFSFHADATATTDGKRGRMEGDLIRGDVADTFESIYVGGSVYATNDDGKWVKNAQLPGSTMPPAPFVSLVAGADDVEEVGSETLDGARTTHYRSPLDAEALDEGTGVDMIDRLSLLADSGKVEIVADIWVGAGGRPTRIALELTAPDVSDGSFKMTSDIVAYDVPVHAKAPPAREVVRGQG